MRKSASDAGRARSAPPETLEDRVYRSTLAEGNRWVRGLGFRSAGPPAIAVYLVLAVGGLLLSRPTTDSRQMVRSVAIVLQEGPGPASPGTPGPDPAASAPKVRPPAAPATRPKDPPLPDPVRLSPPAAAPSTLPKEDHSADPGGGAAVGGAAGSGAAGGRGPGGTGAGGGGGRGAGGGGGTEGPGIAPVPALDLSQVRVTARPAKPDYPLLAQKAGIQGSVVVPILVGVEGIPLSARAVDGPGPLRRAAETFALAFRFEPYRVNGVPQAFRFTLTVTFTLRN